MGAVEILTKDQAREKCKSDMLYLGQVLGYDFQDDVHKDMFEALQRTVISKGTLQYRLILWPRGHFKTSAVVVAIVQTILNNPDTRILLMQGTLKLTKGWLREIASHFNGENPKSKLLSLFSRFMITHSTGDHFTVGARTRTHLKEATVTAASPRAITTGQHYDDLFADDLVNAINFRNVELMDKLDSEFNHFLPLIEPGGYVTVTGTRYSYADLYQRIIDRDRDRDEWTISIRECFDPRTGSLLFPARILPDGRTIGFTPELLAKLQSDDPEMFGPQYLNKILAARDQIFHERLILEGTRSSKDPEFPVSIPCLLFVDLAESISTRADNSVICAARRDPYGRIWISEVVGNTWSPAQLATVILQQALIHRPVKVLLDQQPGSAFFMEYLRVRALEVGMALSIDILKAKRHKDAKHVRIASLESQLRNRRLFLCQSITDMEKLTTELIQFPRGRHDDRPDVIALAFEFFNQGVAIPMPPAPVHQHDGINQLIQDARFGVQDTKPCSSMLGEGFV